MTQGRISRARFIRVSAILGAGVVGASALVSCGNKESSASPATTGGKRQASDSGVSPGEVIAPKKEVEPNSSVPYTNSDSGQPEVLVRLTDGKFVAYSAVCTHQGCTVSYQPQTKELVCPCHGGIYDPAKGAAVVSGPPPRPLPEIDITLKNGKIFRA